MPQKLKLSVLICHFPYAGNGSCSAEHPDIRTWETQTVLKMSKDDRVGAVETQDLSDTPITMTRNRAIRIAQQKGVDLLLMVDSDQSPDLHKNESWFKPFWDTAFTFIYDNYHKGPRLVFAPYCGPPNGSENVYVFHWGSLGNHGDQTTFSLDQYTREQASIMAGIQEAAAGPTGMILIDMRLPQIIEPSGMPRRDVLEQVQSGQMSVDDALWALKEGFFYYEWKDSYADEKASTEDVTFTRDVSLAGIEHLGYNPVFCAWDSWIGHHKPWNVGRPKQFTADHVNQTLRRAVLRNQRHGEAAVEAANLPGIFNPHEVVRQPIRRSLEWHEYGHAHNRHAEFLAYQVQSIKASRLWDHGTESVRVLEVGSWLGTTAIAMADAGAVVHCVDHWQGTASDDTGKHANHAGGPDAVYAEFLRRIGDRLDKSIMPYRQSSADAAAMYWDQFDLIFIDADHSYEGCKADVLAWWRHLKDDGVMIGHDYMTDQFPGVVQAVHELFGALPVVAKTEYGGMWMVKKSDYPLGPGQEKSNGKLAHA